MKRILITGADKGIGLATVRRLLDSYDETFVGVGDTGTIITSSDGSSWTSRTSGTTHNLRGINYVNSTFMAVGESGTILTSSDGITWTSRTSGTSIDLYGVSYKE